MKLCTISLTLLLLLTCASQWSCKREEPAPATTSPSAQGPQLKIETLKSGHGTAARPGNTLEVHYTGYLAAANSKFESSRDRGKPFTFQLGAGRVIKGWDQGMVGMQPGEIRRLTIPPELGYGSRGSGPIPPNATLIFEVELLSIR